MDRLRSRRPPRPLLPPPLNVVVTWLQDVTSIWREELGRPVRFRIDIAAIPLSKVHQILVKLQLGVDKSYNHWKVLNGGMDLLKNADAHHYSLELLLLILELTQMDLLAGILLKDDWFKSLRESANSVVGTTHKSRLKMIFRTITFEVHTLGRVARALGFAKDDVEPYEMTVEEQEWFEEMGGTDSLPSESSVDHKEKLISKFSVLRETVSELINSSFTM